MIIDNAYGAPFPNIIFTDTQLDWNRHTILCMSLSKLGLPAARTGIVVADGDTATMLTRINAVMNLAPGGIGASIALQLVSSGRILELTRNVIRPFYEQRVEMAIEQLREELNGLDYHIHKAEGTFFLWLWFRGLPISSVQLYERLKARGVLVVPGNYFFPGLEEPWRHKNECIRVNYAREQDVVRRGIRVITEQVKRAYAEG